MKNIKILLIQPPIRDFFYTPHRREPLGLLYIKSTLEELNNVEVKLYNALLNIKKKKKRIPKKYNYLKDIYKKDSSPYSLFHHFYHYGDSFTQIREYILKDNYDLIGISSNFTCYHQDVEKLIKFIKEKVDTPIVVGGHAITSEKENLFNISLADYFIYGDGEEPMKKLILYLRGEIRIENIPHLIYRKNGKIKINKSSQNIKTKENLDKLIIKRESIRKNYRFRGYKIASIITSKGCKYKCKFCSIPYLFNNFTLRSLSSIEEELEYLLNLGVELINFEDDNLFSDEKRNKDFIPLLKKYNKKGLKYIAMNGIVASNLLKVIDEILDIGFIEFNVSLVSSKKDICNIYKRPTFYSHIEKLIQKVNGKIPIIVFLIFGLPSMDNRNILNDILYLSNLPVKIGPSPLYFVPNVPLFQELGLPQDRDLYRASALYKFPKNFTRENIASLWKLCRFINWCKEKIDRDKFELNDKEEEYYFYFKKSIKTKQWYVYNKDKWEPSFKFSIDLPLKFYITSLKGKKYSMDLSK